MEGRDAVCGWGYTWGVAEWVAGAAGEGAGGVWRSDGWVGCEYDDEWEQCGVGCADGGRECAWAAVAAGGGKRAEDRGDSANVFEHQEVKTNVWITSFFLLC